MTSITIPVDRLADLREHILGGNSREALKSYIERIERLEEEKAALSGDIKSIFDDAKGNGFDMKALKHVLKLRKMTEGDRRSFEGTVETYEHALGMLDAEARA